MKPRFYNGWGNIAFGQWLHLETRLRDDAKDVMIARLEARSIQQERKIDEIGYMVAAINSGMAANGMYKHMGVNTEPSTPLLPRKPVGFGSELS